VKSRLTWKGEVDVDDVSSCNSLFRLERIIANEREGMDGGGEMPADAQAFYAEQGGDGWTE